MLFQVTGMSCAACSARVEKAVSKVEGVTSVSVNLLTASMQTEGSATAESIIAAVEKAGYGAALKTQAKDAKKAGKDNSDEELKDKETPLLLKRLWWSLGFLLVLMYLSMGYNMFGFPLPGFLEENPVGIGILQMFLALVVMGINFKFFSNGLKGVLHGAPNMDTLVGLGSAAAFVYSFALLLVMSKEGLEGGTEAAMPYLHELYFESAAMILTLITVGKTLEARSKGKTTDAIKSLMKLSPKTAILLKGNEEVEVPVDDVVPGDVFLVRAGDRIPLDGVVIKGNGAVDESALTGESIPVDKKAGDVVSAATVNQSGFLQCETLRVGGDTTLARIIETVKEASASKAPIAKLADKVSGIFVPCVLAIAFVTFCVWLLLGEELGFALARGISVLVISCPCALGLATPVAIMVGSGVGAKKGILFKTAAALEEMGRIRVMALDKTGTITKGEPAVTDVVPGPDCSREKLLKYAYSLEVLSEHPLAGAVVKYGKNKTTPEEVTDFVVLPGNGLKGNLNGQTLAGGSLSFMEKEYGVSGELSERAKQFAKEGKTPLLFAMDGKVLGIIAVADIIKEDSRMTIEELRKQGIHVVMLTGDNVLTAEEIGRQAGVDEIIAGVLPHEKAAVIKRLKEKGKVAMVGDGINDAPALVEADVGVAIGAGADIAIDAADVVLMKSDLRDAAGAYRIGKATLGTIRMNLFWAFFYNCIGIPVAAGVLIPAFGFYLNPMIAAAAMSLSSFCVVSNALRLNFCKVYPGELMHLQSEISVPKTGEIKESEDKKMKKKMEIKGMMCGHCSGRVKKVLEALPEVDAAEVSHETGLAIITLNGDVSDETLKKIVEDEGYEVLDLSVEN